MNIENTSRFHPVMIQKYLEIAIQKEIRAGRGGRHGGIIADLRHMKDDYIRHVPDDCGLHHMWPGGLANHMNGQAGGSA